MAKANQEGAPQGAPDGVTASRRSVDEWIGATPDSAPPLRVRLRVFERFYGRCHWSGRKIMPGDPWDLDHVLALCNGGENRESNLAPILRGKQHRAKSNQDLAIKVKTDRTRKKHLGLRPKGRLTHPDLKRGFDGKVRPRNPSSGDE